MGLITIDEIHLTLDWFGARSSFSNLPYYWMNLKGEILKEKVIIIDFN